MKKIGNLVINLNIKNGEELSIVEVINYNKIVGLDSYVYTHCTEFVDIKYSYLYESITLEWYDKKSCFVKVKLTGDITQDTELIKNLRIFLDNLIPNLSLEYFDYNNRIYAFENNLINSLKKQMNIRLLNMNNKIVEDLKTKIIESKLPEKLLLLSNVTLSYLHNSIDSRISFCLDNKGFLLIENDNHINIKCIVNIKINVNHIEIFIYKNEIELTNFTDNIFKSSLKDTDELIEYIKFISESILNSLRIVKIYDTTYDINIK